MYSDSNFQAFLALKLLFYINDLISFLRNGQWNTCVQCGGKFKGRNQLLKHQRTMHPATNTGTVLCRFLSCAYVCHRIQQLVDHMKQAHMLEVVTTEHRFDCEEGGSVQNVYG